MESSKPFEIIIKPAQKRSIDLSELWQYRELFYFFAWRDIKVKYKQTVLGFLWVVIQPLFMVVIFTFFFSRSVYKQAGSLEYPVFAFAGLILWNLFSSGVTNAGNSMVSNANIIKKIYFPRLIIPTSAVIGAVFDFLMSFIIFIIFMIFYHVSIDFLKLLYCWPLAFLFTIICTFGSGCWLSALTIKYRDFRYLIPFLMQAMLFLTPVILPISVLPNETARMIAALNPMYAAITLFRMPLESAPQDWSLLMVSFISGLILFMVGLSYFKRTESYFADIA